MSFGMKQIVGMHHELKMTPQLQQAIHMLQLTAYELTQSMQEEQLENPMLEMVEDGDRDDVPAAAEPNGATASLDGNAGDDRRDGFDVADLLNKYREMPPLPAYASGREELPSLEATLTRAQSLTDHLVWQLRLSRFDELDGAIAMLIIGNVDADGRLCESPEQIASECGQPIDDVLRVLGRVQQFDPVGVAARDIQECLLIQARHRQIDDSIVIAMLERHFGALQRRNYSAIAHDLAQPLDEIVLAARAIEALSPWPGRLFRDEEPIYVRPDVYVHKTGDRYFVTSNDDGLPKLRLARYYQKALSHSPEAKKYINGKVRSARWLINAVEQRRRTMIAVTESILKFQREFFDRGPGHLKPLVLREVADDINRHESTVSRATSQKYMQTPRGTFELKYFFSAPIQRNDGDAIASRSVKERLDQIVASEDRRNPYSDQDLVAKLRAEGTVIARRTVAKYRDQLGLLGSSFRRQVG